jgi:hypothetical protein
MRASADLTEDALRVLDGLQAEAAIELIPQGAVGVGVPLLRAAADREEALEHGEVEAGDTGHG